MQIQMAVHESDNILNYEIKNMKWFKFDIKEIITCSEYVLITVLLQVLQGNWSFVLKVTVVLKLNLFSS